MNELSRLNRRFNRDIAANAYPKAIGTNNRGTNRAARLRAAN